MKFALNCLFLEFFEAKVSYQMESPTVSLENVFFPSVALCNMNVLRKTFVLSLIKDPSLESITNYIAVQNFSSKLADYGVNITK